MGCRRVHPARHALRLYACLSATQRQALWEGQVLPVAEMTPTRRACFLLALQRGSREESGPLELEAWAGGGFSLASQRTLHLQEPRGGSAQSGDVPAPAPLAAPLRAAIQPAARGGGAPGAEASGTFRPLTPAIGPPAAERSPVTEVRFDFHYGAEGHASVSLIVWTH